MCDIKSIFLSLMSEKTPPANEPTFPVYVSGESLLQKERGALFM